MDILVSAVGTGGTITGISEVIKSRKKGFQSIAVEPKDSPVITQTRSRGAAQARPAQDPGHGRGLRARRTCNLKIVDEVITVSNEDAIRHRPPSGAGRGHPCRHFDRRECLGGHAGGRRPENKGKLIVTIGCSTGERYLSTALAEEARKQVTL